MIGVKMISAVANSAGIYETNFSNNKKMIPILIAEKSTIGSLKMKRYFDAVCELVYVSRSIR
jgi:hypothetical protein